MSTEFLLSLPNPPKRGLWNVDTRLQQTPADDSYYALPTLLVHILLVSPLALLEIQPFVFHTSLV